MIDVTEILVHWHAGRSLNEMSQSLGADRKTIRKYIAPAIAAGIAPGGPAKSEGEWQDLVREWFPELAGDAAAAGDVAGDRRLSTSSGTFAATYRRPVDGHLRGEPEAVQQIGGAARRVPDVEQPPDQRGDAVQGPALVLAPAPGGRAPLQRCPQLRQLGSR